MFIFKFQIAYFIKKEVIKIPIIIDYNRKAAVDYANKWALSRNKRYFDFSNLGGDCTNFVSQCLYAGSNIMNYIPIYGWYYNSANDRSASWTGVEYLYNFLTTNKTKGVFAKNVKDDEVEIGDIVQLGDSLANFYHSLIITKTGELPSINNILVNTHTFDAKQRPLKTYIFEKIRFLHIQGIYV